MNVSNLFISSPEQMTPGLRLIQLRGAIQAGKTVVTGNTRYFSISELYESVAEGGVDYEIPGVDTTVYAIWVEIESNASGAGDMVITFRANGADKGTITVGPGITGVLSTTALSNDINDDDPINWKIVNSGDGNTKFVSMGVLLALR